VSTLAAAALAGATGCREEDREAPAPRAAACVGKVLRGPIPAWADAGFSRPRPPMPHAISREGKLAALLLGDPLSSPPARGRANKILWVPRRAPRSASDLRIRARRYAGDSLVGPVVTRVVQGGPGPSIVNLPAPGCWRLRLAWSGEIDRIDLRYRGR
jgi:hypothetical protein